jgi:hypothetical protein
MTKKRLDHVDDHVIVASVDREAELYYSAPVELADGSYALASVPPHVDLELTNVCDLACEFCETLVMKRKPGMMSLKLFKKIVDQCEAIGVRSCKLNLWGESLLNKQLCNMVDYAKTHSKLILQFNTNANRLTPEISRRLVSAGLDRLTVSIDGITKETYEKLRVKGSYEDVFRNVHDLMDIKKQLNTNDPHLTVQIIRTTENANEIEPFVEYWKNCADQVTVTNIGITVTESILRFSLRERNGLGRKACEQPWQRLSVLWDGTVTVCCSDFEGVLAIGKVDETSLLDLWHGEKLTRLRRRHAARDFDGLICKTCTETRNYSNIAS